MLKKLIGNKHPGIAFNKHFDRERPCSIMLASRLLPVLGEALSLGPEVKLTIEQQLPGNLSMEDWYVMREVIAAVRQAIPDASSNRPGAVLEHVLEALRAARATPIVYSKNPAG